MRKQLRGSVIAGAMLVMAVVISACSGGGQTVSQQPQSPVAAAQPQAAAPAADPRAPSAAAQLATGTQADAMAVPQGTSAAAAAQFKLEPESGVPQYGGIFRIGETNDAATLNFWDAAGRGTMASMYKTYDRLVNWAWEGNEVSYKTIAPSLAVSWETSGDGTVWTFKLRDGVRFHDGTPFSCQDVEASYDAYLNQGDRGPSGNSYTAPIIDTATCLDSKTLVLNLKGPSPILLQNLAHAVVSIGAKRDLDRGFDWYNNNANGTGPFVWLPDKWERGIGYAHTRNEDYWDEGLPYLDGQKTFFVADLASRIAAFETKRIDTLKGVRSVTQADRILKRYGDQVRIIRRSQQNGNFAIYNTRKPPFDNPKVREALYLWMDRAQFLEKAGEGQGWTGEFIHPGVYPDVKRLGVGNTLETLQKAQHLAFQVDKTAARKRAKELLAEAGYSDLSGIKVRVVVQTPSGANLKSNQILVAQLKEMGFDAVLEVTERLTSARMFRKGDFDAVVYGTTAGYPNIIPMLNRAVWSQGVRNFSGLVDETLDGLLAELNKAITPEDQKRILTEMDQILLKGQHATHLMYHAKTQVIEWGYVKGHRYLTGFQEEKNDHTWLGLDAPSRR